VSDGGRSFAMSIPLDANGFLRRQCPTCEREFKWLHTSDPDQAVPVLDGGYFCPYCGVQAPTNAWLTQAQVALAVNTVATEGVGPLLAGTGFKYEPPDKLDPLTEGDDMKRVDFQCHPTEPVKIVDDWSRSVHCLICGAIG